MGFFDFLKKDTDENIEKEPEKPRFYGDLAFAGIQTTKNEDSSDAYIILPFTEDTQTGWICKECGTRNRMNLDYCEVCGYNEKENMYVL